jgi:hypothetical protein
VLESDTTFGTYILRIDSLAKHEDETPRAVRSNRTLPPNSKHERPRTSSLLTQILTLRPYQRSYHALQTTASRLLLLLYDRNRPRHFQID